MKFHGPQAAGDPQAGHPEARWKEQPGGTVSVRTQDWEDGLGPGPGRAGLWGGIHTGGFQEKDGGVSWKGLPDLDAHFLLGAECYKQAWPWLPSRPFPGRVGVFSPYPPQQQAAG